MLPVKPARKTLTDVLRAVFRKLLNRSAATLDRLGVTPNMITIFGLIGTAIAAFFVYRGQLFVAAIAAAVSAAMDAFDGSLARYQGIKGPFGAFLDSTIDRYGEGLLLMGLGLYFLEIQKPAMILVTGGAILGSMLVSYTRARGEAVGYTVRCGLFTRVERAIVLIFSLAAGYPEVGVVLVAVFANFTAIQRILTVVQQEKDSSGEQE